MRITLQKLVSGLIAGAAAGLIFGFVIGMFTMFLGSIPGFILGAVLGFLWGFRRVGSEEQGGDASLSPPRGVGDTALLAVGFFGTIWLACAVPDLFFGYSGPYKGHPMGMILTMGGIALSPVAAFHLERYARKNLTEPLRNLLGIGLLALFLVLVALWWNWAVARDQAKAHDTAGVGTRSVTNQKEERRG